MAEVRLAIIDWGIGGISILKLLKDRLGDVPVIYFSDTGVTPYGKMSRLELGSRLNAVVMFLRDRGATHFVLGCNAASTALPLSLCEDVPIKGMIDSGVSVSVRNKPGRLGLIGGRRTVMSGVYRRAFRERNIELVQRIAQPLSGFIESGDTSSDKLRSECRHILLPLKDCSHILLACTHYPAILPLIQECAGENTCIIDPAGELVRSLINWDLRPSSKGDEYITSGDADRMRIAATSAFNWRISKTLRISI
jgi:glutamate racemase